MTRLLLLGAVALVPLACGPSGPRTLDTAKPIPIEQTPDAVTPPVAADRPAASDPESGALVNAALDAHTGGDRAKVRQLRTVDYTRVGTGRSLEESPLGLTWAVNCAWPDRIRVRAEFPGPKILSIVLNGDAGFQRLEGGPVMPMTPEAARDLQIDISGEWVWLLFPLLDGDAAFAPAPPLPADPSLKGVKFFHPKLAPSLVYFHPETKLLTRIVYEGRELGSPGLKEFQVIEQGEFAGVKLPKRLAQVFRGKQYADWVTTKLEPRAAADGQMFRAE